MERMDKNSKELMDDPFLLASWIAKSMAGELSDEELQLLDEWRMASERNRRLYDRIVSREGWESKQKHFTAFDKVSGWQGYSKKLKKTEKKEMPFAEIMDDLLNSIGTEDTYSTDYVAVFEVCGEKVSIEDEQLARALKAIEERKRNIVLQYFFIGDTDTYIGKMLDCSRANVTKCRIQALDKLKQLIEEEKEKCQKS